jgi:Kef-type K+ transport system membrane component KefB
MAIGMVYINTTHDDRLFKQLNYFSPPLLLLFFVRSGASFMLSDLVADSRRIGGFSLMAISIIYFLVRILGKYIGAYVGCLSTGKDKKVRNYLGLGLIPQAGVAIGLAAMCARILGPGVGTDMQTIILFSSVLYELIGPACGKLSLYLSGSYSTKLENLTQVTSVDAEGHQKSAVELLIERIDNIQKEIAKERLTPSSEETAYNQAIDELLEDNKEG